MSHSGFFYSCISCRIFRRSLAGCEIGVTGLEVGLTPMLGLALHLAAELSRKPVAHLVAEEGWVRRPESAESKGVSQPLEGTIEIGQGESRLGVGWPRLQTAAHPLRLTNEGGEVLRVLCSF